MKPLMSACTTAPVVPFKTLGSAVQPGASSLRAMWAVALSVSVRADQLRQQGVTAALSPCHAVQQGHQLAFGGNKVLVACKQALQGRHGSV